jgi:class 3 adenylate cyclase
MFLAYAHSLSIAGITAAIIFIVDTFSSLQFAVASLYVIVILLAAADLNRRGVMIAAFVCCFLTLIGHFLMHGFDLNVDALLRSAVSLISIVIGTTLVINNLLANERLKETERQRANLARFFSPKIVDQLIGVDTPLSIARYETAAVMFVDMIGSTAYSSGKTPDVVIGMLRELLALLSESVFANNGTIDKFLGDGLMAVFGPPLKSPLDATNAASCALHILDSLHRWNEERGRSGEMEVRVAIGIHYGDVVQGDVGNNQRLELTVVGDTVNIASRVESYCRTLDAALLVTGEFVDALVAEGGIQLGRIFADEGMHVLRGRVEPIRLYSLKRS